jgi:hypothetical protein
MSIKVLVMTLANTKVKNQKTDRLQEDLDTMNLLVTAEKKSLLTLKVFWNQMLEEYLEANKVQTEQKFNLIIK